MQQNKTLYLKNLLIKQQIVTNIKRSMFQSFETEQEAENPLKDNRPSMQSNVNNPATQVNSANAQVPPQEQALPQEDAPMQVADIDNEFNQTAKRYLGNKQYKEMTTSVKDTSLDQLNDKPVLQMLPLSTQARTVDIIYKGIVHNISEICEKTNIHVEKSPVLSAKME